MNHDNKKNTTILSVLALLIAVVGISISFLVISSDIKLIHIRDDNKKDWLIEFSKLSNPKTNGNAIELTSPSISNGSTVVGGFSVKFNKPKDSISYDLSLKNGGRIDSILEHISKTIPKCVDLDGKSNKETDMVCKNIDYYLILENGKKVKEGLKLKHGDEIKLTLTIKYNGETLPNKTVLVNNISLMALFIQDGEGM